MSRQVRIAWPDSHLEVPVRSGLEDTSLVANTAAFLSFFLLWLAVVWGIVLRNGWASIRVKYSTMYGIHQTVALLGLCLGAVHAFAVEVMRGAQVRVIDVLVPFASQIGPLSGGVDRYHTDVATTAVNPLGIGVAALGLELLVATAVSVLIQRRIGNSRWRGVHSLAYAGFALLVAHIMISGANSHPLWITISVIGCWLVTVALWLGAPLWVRFIESPLGRSMSPGRQATAMSVSVDAVRCERSGFCAQAAPTVFKLRNEGRLSYRPSVNATEIEAVTRAAKICPVRAITLGLVATTMVTDRPPEFAEEVGPIRPRATTGPRRPRDLS
jgi:ferredoxin